MPPKPNSTINIPTKYPLRGGGTQGDRNENLGSLTASKTLLLHEVIQCR